MDTQEKLMQEIKKSEKISIIVGSIICIILSILNAVAIIERVKAVNNGETETSAYLSFGVICMIILEIVIFVKSILLVCLDLKNVTKNYEKKSIIVIQIETKLGDHITWDYEVLAENTETGERFVFEGSKDMKEGDKYYFVRARHSGFFAYTKKDD